MQITTSSIIENILKNCFWDYNFTENEILNIVNGNDFAKKQFLFRKILLNSTRVLTDLKIFNHQELKRMIETFKVPTFNHDYIFRRHNIVEVYFLDKPLLIDELKWVA